MFELLVMRHGQTDWNIDGQKRVMGRRPIPLNREGRNQVRRTARSLREMPLVAIYSSPIVRALQSAQLVMQGRGAIPLIEEEGLAEIDYGAWLDRELTDIMQSEAWRDYWCRGAVAQVPGGERVIDVQRRSVAAASRARAQYPDGRILFVSHADVIKALMAYYLCVPLDEWQSFKIDNASISVVRFESDRPRVWRLNANGY